MIFKWYKSWKAKRVRKFIDKAKTMCTHYHTGMPDFWETLKKIKLRDDVAEVKPRTIKVRLVGYQSHNGPYYTFDKTIECNWIEAYCIARYKAFIWGKVVDRNPNGYNDCGVEWEIEK